MFASGKKVEAGTPGFASRCRVELTDDQEILDDSETRVELATEIYDDNAEFASYQFTAKAAGRYHIDAEISFYDAVAVHEVVAYVTKDGTEIIWNSLPATVIDNQIHLNMSGDINLSIGSIIELYVWHDKGAALNLSGGSGVAPFLSIHRFA